MLPAVSYISLPLSDPKVSYAATVAGHEIFAFEGGLNCIAKSPPPAVRELLRVFARLGLLGHPQIIAVAHDLIR